MPRDRGSGFKSKVMARPTAHNAVIASARNLSHQKLPSMAVRSAMKAGAWQEAAWNFYDTIGEFRFSVAWVGNVMSKAKLTVLYDGKPTDKQVALDALASLFGGPDGQTEMFRQLGIHLTLAGDSYILAGEDEDGNDDWLIAAASETEGPNNDNDTKWVVGKVITYDDPLVIRLWKPHPRKPLSSDCPSRAVLPILSELDGLTKHVAATIDSRLASAGILFVPSEISFGSSSSETGEDGEKQDQASADGLVTELIRVASMAIADRSDASALVPIVAQVAGEFVDKITHLTFWGKFDDQTILLRNEAIRRLALGMDMPPEILQGSADMNHWSSWQIEEAAIKSHTEPLLAIIVSSLAAGYLRPLLLDEDGIDEAEAKRYSFGYDDAAMRLRPNRSKEAMELYDRGELSGAALIRENGFALEDVMTETERASWLLRKVASGSATPDMVLAALAALNVHLAGALGINRSESDSESKSESESTSDSLDAPNEARPTPSLEEHPTRNPPPETPRDGDPLAAAAEQIVFRAIERAGNKLRTKMNRKISGVTASATYMHVDVDESEIEFLLADSWTGIIPLAHRYHVDAASMEEALRAYVRETLLNKREYEFGQMQTFLYGAIES